MTYPQPLSTPCPPLPSDPLCSSGFIGGWNGSIWGLFGSISQVVRMVRVVNDIIDALRGNETLTKLSVANTNLSDRAPANLVLSLECNNAMESLNIESNNVTPQTLAKPFASLNVQESVIELKAMIKLPRCSATKLRCWSPRRWRRTRPSWRWACSSSTRTVRIELPWRARRTWTE